MAEEFNSLNDILYEESKELITNFLNQDFNNLFSTPYNQPKTFLGDSVVTQQIDYQLRYLSNSYFESAFILIQRFDNFTEYGYMDLNILPVFNLLFSAIEQRVKSYLVVNHKILTSDNTHKLTSLIEQVIERYFSNATLTTDALTAKKCLESLCDFIETCLNKNLHLVSSRYSVKKSSSEKLNKEESIFIFQHFHNDSTLIDLIEVNPQELKSIIQQIYAQFYWIDYFIDGANETSYSINKNTYLE